MPFTLPALPYDYDALEPHIDARTMKIHHTKHHQGYVDKLNAALEGHPDLAKRTIDTLLRDLDTVPADIRTAVRNNGGGHANHSLFWRVMTKGGSGKPDGALLDAINQAFGDFEAFRKEFTQAALTRFGSGWAWLVVSDDRLAVESTPNQDSPLMRDRTPILGLDVWEHAYYLNYQNKRADYIAAWWNVINWEAVAKRFEAVRAQTPALAAAQ
ncbi:MAG TPA: superoxide dismutase [Gemmatimonadales bacterium]|nr:superoxide dismutase [Gemmatimonadales bacterium]